MGRSLGDLAKSMRKRADELPELGNTVAKAGVTAMLKELVEVTPVDTSEALSNWQVGIGLRPATAIRAHVLGRKGSTRSASSDEAIARGQAEIKIKQPGQTIYLSNATPYIGDLDIGTSMQFPGGFIARALIVFKVAAQSAKKRFLK